jgi:hypothetical protein
MMGYYELRRDLSIVGDALGTQDNFLWRQATFPFLGEYIKFAPHFDDYLCRFGR